MRLRNLSIVSLAFIPTPALATTYVCEACPAGTWGDGTNCNTCKAGTYAYAGSSSCTSCPAGKYSAAGASSCSTCAAGTYSGTGAGSCTSCPAGTYSTGGASSCTNCLTTGVATCDSKTGKATGCSAGYGFNSSNGTCTICSAGTYSPGGSGSCYSCASGYYSNAGAANCTACTNKPSNSSYTSNSTSNSCSWSCNSGYKLSGNTCVKKQCYVVIGSNSFYIDVGDKKETVLTTTYPTCGNSCGPSTIGSHTYGDTITKCEGGYVSDSTINNGAGTATTIMTCHCDTGK